MTLEVISLGLAAAWTGFIHCLCGPDHYVPFVAMSRVGQWSLRKTLTVTMLCGVGHVLGSVLLGSVGIALGLILFRLEEFESLRGVLAAWMLFGFGAVYTLVGILHAVRHQPHTHAALIGASSEPAEAGVEPPRSWTPWVLFVVFLFGPCEPLIPFFFQPAIQGNVWGIAWIALLFSFTTLATMLVLVALIYRGAIRWDSHPLHRWGHAVAGVIVMVCGGAMLVGF